MKKKKKSTEEKLKRTEIDLLRMEIDALLAMIGQKKINRNTSAHGGKKNLEEHESPDTHSKKNSGDK